MAENTKPIKVVKAKDENFEDEPLERFTTGALRAERLRVQELKAELKAFKEQETAQRAPDSELQTLRKRHADMTKEYQDLELAAEEKLHQLTEQQAQITAQFEREVIKNAVIQSFYANGGRKGISGSDPDAFFNMLMPLIESSLKLKDGKVLSTLKDGQEGTVDDLIKQKKKGAAGAFFELTPQGSNTTPHSRAAGNGKPDFSKMDSIQKIEWGLANNA